MAEPETTAAPPTGPRSTRIAATVLGLAGAIVGGASAVASVFARVAPDFTLVPESLPAGLTALAFAVLGAVGAAETGAHPRFGGVAMLLGAIGGYAAIQGDYGITPVLMGVAGVLALTVPPAEPHHHRLPALLRPSRG